MRPFAFLLALLLAAPLAFAQNNQSIPPFWDSEWSGTDFSKASVSFVEILSGGVSKDQIPAIDDPVFLNIEDVDDIPDLEPVVTLEIEGERPRAYPIRYLTYHEFVNDRVGDIPVAVTFCPLCNSALVFDGRLDGKELTFGVSGKLRHSDMVMYDRQTESWWQQFDGEGIVGELTGARLEKLPGWMEGFGEFKARNPDGIVMAEPRARRPYGQNPYVGYDTRPRPYGFYNGEDPPHGIEPLARVLRVEEKAWPLSRLQKTPELIEDGLRITWGQGQASALDGRDIAQSRDVGTVRVFDAETGKPVAHEVVFAFAFHAFEPEGVWMLGN